MTATPMKDSADDILYLLNLIRPQNDPIQRDKVFSSQGADIDIRESGLDYFKKMANGYVSYWRGADPFVFAERVDMGSVPKGLKFTKVTQCKMEKLQYQVYKTIEDDVEDALDRKSTAVANFVFPYIENKQLVGLYGKSGITKLITILKNGKKPLLELIKKEYKMKEDIDSIIYYENDMLGGMIFNEKYLKHFSTKF
jgi:hypothetical protein